MNEESDNELARLRELNAKLLADRSRLLKSCARFLKAKATPHVVPASHGGSFFLRSVAAEKKSAFSELVATVNEIGNGPSMPI